MNLWLRFREKLERRKPLDTADGSIVNLDQMPDGTVRKALRACQLDLPAQYDSGLGMKQRPLSAQERDNANRPAQRQRF